MALIRTAQLGGCVVALMKGVEDDVIVSLGVK